MQLLHCKSIAIKIKKKSLQENSIHLLSDVIKKKKKVQKPVLRKNGVVSSHFKWGRQSFIQNALTGKNQKRE